MRPATAVLPVAPIPFIGSRPPAPAKTAAHRAPPARQDRSPRGLASWVSAIAFIGLHLAALGVLFVEFTWTGVALGVGLYLLRGFGLTAGFHRYFAHRAFKTSRWFQFCLALFGAMSLQRGAIWWAGHHRLHHKHSDQEDDPHSPIVKSVWWSHVGWVLSNRYNTTDWELMKDFQKYPELRWLEKFDVVPGILTGVLCLLVGGWSGLFWGFFLGTVCLYHATFMVNSVCHLFGRRRFETTDRSRNNWLVAIVAMGEGWHNNHHHYPSAARQGFKWYEYDLSYMILKVLSWVGIVWDLRQPTPRALAKNTVAN